jgi:hypothetical protein
MMRCAWVDVGSGRVDGRCDGGGGLGGWLRWPAAACWFVVAGGLAGCRPATRFGYRETVVIEGVRLSVCGVSSEVVWMVLVDSRLREDWGLFISLVLCV